MDRVLGLGARLVSLAQEFRVEHGLLGRRVHLQKPSELVPDQAEAEAVNFFEAGRRDNYGAGETSTGLLIQAGPGNGGGTGAWRTKRSG